MLLNCVIYLSEARNALHIQRCLNYCKVEHLPLIHWFVDEVYNRSSFYFVTALKENQSHNTFITQLLSVCHLGYDSVSFQQHSGLHPTLGTIDHICFSPLFIQRSLDPSSRLAQLGICEDIASDFASKYYNSFQVPIYMYGSSSFAPSTTVATGRRLQDIRRSLGYFQATSSNSLAHSLKERIVSNPAGIFPSYGGGDEYSPDNGITCIGCVPLIQNYNIRIKPSASFIGTSENEVKRKIAQITKAIRSNAVEALTLPYHETSTPIEEPNNEVCFEIACNLLNPYLPDGVTSDQVHERVTALARENDLEIVSAYSTNPLESELIDKYQQFCT